MEFLLRFVGAFLRFLNWIITPFFRLYEHYHRKEVPEPKDPLLFISATELARKIRYGELCSSEVIKSYIRRIKEVNPYVNAVVEERFKEALNEAAFVDNFLSNTKIDEQQLMIEKPLLGVPITIKESCRVKDMELSVGNLSRLNLKASEDGDAVRLLRYAGAIPLLVSNTPEYCLSWETSNFVTGTARNPYNSCRTPGGSSGGEGALLGAAASVIGIGSDLAGSIRLPALFNGVYGHKPTAGVVSVDGHFPVALDKDFYKYLAVGPLCRYAEDLPLMLQIMAGNNAAQLNLNETVDVSKLRIYHMDEAGKSLAFLPVDDEIKVAIKNAVSYLKKEHNCVIVDKKFDMDDTCELGSLSLVQIKSIPNIIVKPDNPKEKLNIWLEMVKSFFGLSRHQFNIIFFYILRYTLIFFFKRKYRFYNEETQKMKETFVNELGTNGVFIYPTFPSSAFHLGKLPFVALATMYPLIFNILGFPCTHVPLGFDKDGMPIGFQIVGAPYQDKLCLAVAQALEKGFGGWKPTSSTS